MPACTRLFIRLRGVAPVAEPINTDAAVQANEAQLRAHRAAFPAYFAMAYAKYPALPAGTLEAIAMSTSRWNEFVRVLEPDLSALRYSSLFTDLWDPQTGPADNARLVGVALTRDAVHVAGWRAANAGVALGDVVLSPSGRDLPNAKARRTDPRFAGLWLRGSELIRREPRKIGEQWPKLR